MYVEQNVKQSTVCPHVFGTKCKKKSTTWNEMKRVNQMYVKYKVKSQLYVEQNVKKSTICPHVLGTKCKKVNYIYMYMEQNVKSQLHVGGTECI